MPDFPFGKSVDPRDIQGELHAREVRVNIWVGRTGQFGGACTTYAVAVEELGAVLTWIEAHPDTSVEVGLVVRIDNTLYLIGVDRNYQDLQR